MKILHRYYIGEFLKILGLLTLGLALIFSLLDLVDKVDDFVPGKLSIPRIMEYIFLNFPRYFYFLLPMSLLICSLFVFNHASRNKEIVAIKAIGGRTKKLFYPFIAAGIIFSALSFFVGEIVVPDFSDRMLEYKKSYMKKIGKITYKEGAIWLRSPDGSVIRIELYVPEKKIAKGVSIFMIGEEHLKQRIEAEEALWEVNQEGKGVWKLRSIIVYNIATGEVLKAAEMEYPYLESPDTFSNVMKKPDEMGIIELYHYSEKLKAAGFRDAKLDVDIQARMSYPPANLIMIILGLALSVMGRIGGGLFAAGLGISISFIYWLSYTFMLSMGYARVLPAVAATWIMPAIFGMTAIYLFSKIPE
jgi:lipopolysaccharide export system permease protein